MKQFVFLLIAFLWVSENAFSQSSFETVLQKAKSGDVASQVDVAMIFVENERYEIALEWLNAIIKNPSSQEAQKGLAYHTKGCLYFNGWGVTKDYSIAVEFFRDAYIYKYYDAAYTLATIYDNEKLPIANEALAVEWYLKAADAKVINAYKKAALLCRSGGQLSGKER